MGGRSPPQLYLPKSASETLGTRGLGGSNLFDAVFSLRQHGTLRAPGGGWGDGDAQAWCAYRASSLAGRQGATGRPEPTSIPVVLIESPTILRAALRLAWEKSRSAQLRRMEQRGLLTREDGALAGAGQDGASRRPALSAMLTG